MPLKPLEKICMVPVCPWCGDQVSVDGEGYTHFHSLKELREWKSESGWDRDETLEDMLAQLCERGEGRARGSGDCHFFWRHRRCGARPCGYCRDMETRARQENQDRDRADVMSAPEA